MLFVCPRCVRLLRPLLTIILLFVSTLAFAQSNVPAPWTAQDIGSPSPAGRTTYDAGVFTLAAGGSDIAGRADSFHFVFQPLNGDTRLVARLDTLVPADPASKAGLMIRGSLANSAAHGFIYLNAVNQVVFGRRTSAGGRTTTTTAATTVNAPIWLSLARTGTKVTAAISSNGTTWTTIGSDTVALGTTAYVGYALTAHSSTTAAQADISNGQPANGLPAPMRNTDIGGPTPTGSARYNNGTYTVTAGGLDVWGTSDQFHFVYQPVTGDADVIARVASISGGDISVKAGVMIRAGLTAGAAHAFDIVSQGAGLAYQDRPVTDGASEHLEGGGGRAPTWVRLVRTGTRFEAFRSADGVTWSLIGTRTLTMPQTIYVGLALSGHSSTSAATALFDNVSVRAATTSTNQPPTVSLTSPLANSSGVAPATFAIAANAADPEGRLARVELYANGQLLGSYPTAPCSFAWSGVAAGSYSLTAVAVDQDGNRATSSAVPVTVTTPANQPPTVTLLTPAAGATAIAPAAWTVSASASDPEGRMARVEFYVNGQLLATDTSAPYSVAWTNIASGTYAVLAIAVDQDGGSASSTPAVVSVGTAVAVRTASFTPSPDHNTARVAGYRLQVYAASDTATQNPLATYDLGKPAPDATNTIAVDMSSQISGLPTGNYLATVSAYGPDGSAASAPVAFAR